MDVDITNISAVIMAGGQGTRLFPLTLNHCKPAVPFAGKYRLIDIPISNAIHANIRKIFVLGQYLTAELQHHLHQSFQFDPFLPGSIDLLTPEETPNGEKIWFEGTADSVRKCLPTLLKSSTDYFLILSGDQLYTMDFEKMFAFALKTDADLTVATLPIPKDEASRLGVMKIDDQSKIVDFFEKPQDEKILDDFKVPSNFYKKWKIKEKSSPHLLGSMGIYIFKKEALIRLLQNDTREDFGKHLIPKEIKQGKSFAYVYDGYWEDIGTVQSFYEANLALTQQKNNIDTHNESKPIFTRRNYLPGPQIFDSKVEHSIICEGSLIDAKEVHHSILGVRSQIKKGTVIRDSIIMGSHYYLPPIQHSKKPLKSFSIGENCLIEKCIIDEHVDIGNNVQLINQKNLKTYDGEGIFIRDGIIIVTAGTILPENFVL